jgi:hypothetical protein
MALELSRAASLVRHENAAPEVIIIRRFPAFEGLF